MVVGAGPAGLATAIRAASLGLDTLVLERRAPPLDKACGEGLMPPGLAALSKLGVKLAADEYYPFSGIRFLLDETTAEGHFRGGPGAGVRRTALSSRLLQRAEAVGVRFRFQDGLVGLEQRADGVDLCLRSGAAVSCRHLVGADGLHSRVRTLLGIPSKQGKRRRFGVRRHYPVRPWSSLVEVYWADRSEAYVTPIAADQVGVAILWPGEGGSFEEELSAFPALQARLDGIAPATQAMGAGPFWQKLPRRTEGHAALVGDAAGYADALTGEGISLGLECGLALAERLHEDGELRGYERAYRRITETYYRTTGLFLAATHTPALRRRLIRAVASRPALFSRLLALNMGEPPMRALFGGAPSGQARHDAL